jgi:hypothetical protein
MLVLLCLSLVDLRISTTPHTTTFNHNAVIIIRNTNMVFFFPFFRGLNELVTKEKRLFVLHDNGMDLEHCVNSRIFYLDEFLVQNLLMFYH